MKSILSYGIVGLLSAALLGGSALILLKPSDTYAERGGGRGQANAALIETGAGHHGNGAETSGQFAYGGGEAEKGRGGPGWETSSNNGANNGNGSSNGRGQSGSLGRGQSETATTAEWETLSGTVIAMDGEFIIETAEGDGVTVGLGQSNYREEMGFTLGVGDEVVVTGFYEDGEFKAGAIENLTTGQTIVLREETGRPMWAGGGQLKNQGRGQGQGRP